ncbi:uncharacterized protein LOC109020983 [Juglans regia]|uniref:Uncharacterized protein LOC109020983 n=1 Tax=Juglans regia TaxID=51240 RepID=A0A6P9EA48_JUGRE|nr:uncharacterized protein LOC109020983 [Juglans regia]
MAAAAINGGRRPFVDLVSVVPQPLPDMFVAFRLPKSKDGEIFFQFSKEEVQRSAEPFRYSIVLKFLRNRPSLDAIRAFIHKRWNLDGVPVVSNMRHPRNVFIRMVSEEDCNKALSREVNDIDGIPYRPFHWTPESKEEEEPSLVPVWIVLPGLPPNYYHESFLKILTAPIGRFIRSDNSTRCVTRTDGARICVEMDVAKKPLLSFWIGMPSLETSRKQEIVYETLPAFCSKCHIQGHNLKTCRAGQKNVGKVESKESAKEDRVLVVQADNLDHAELESEKYPEDELEIPERAEEMIPRIMNDHLDCANRLRETELETDMREGEFIPSSAEKDVYDGPAEEVCLEDGSMSDPEPEKCVEVFLQEKEYHSAAEDEVVKRKYQKRQFEKIRSSRRSVVKIHSFMRLLKFDEAISNETDGGKIWVFWKNELDVQVVRMSSQFVSLCITEGSNHFLGNFIYAKCNRLERQLLWEELNSDRMGVEPCLFAGDFNVIWSDIERCGGRLRNRVAIDEFNRWIHQGGLLEMNSQGGKFTWCNGQQGLSRAWAKLDRVLLDANFLSLFSTAHCLYLPRTTSDHCPMVIEFLSDPFSYGPPPFRFQQMCVEHPDFMTLVQKVWSESVIGSGLFKLATKLKKLKVALRVWNKSVFGRTNTQIAILEDKIENLENLLQRGWDDDIERELVRSSNELSSWRLREDIRLAQMAKIKWRMDGDRNTKFFHVWLSNKKHRKIHQLRTSNGLAFNSPEAIHLGVVDYFSDFLQRSNPVREVPDLSSLISSVINDEDCVRLCGIPSLVEDIAHLLTTRKQGRKGTSQGTTRIGVRIVMDASSHTVTVRGVQFELLGICLIAETSVAVVGTSTATAGTFTSVAGTSDADVGTSTLSTGPFESRARDVDRSKVEGTDHEAEDDD